MITDQLTNTIYFSHMLEQVCPDLYRSISALKEKGYPIELKVYIKLRNYDGSLSNNDSDYLFVDDFISERTGNKVLFIFNEKIACDQIKLQWAKMEEIGEQVCKQNFI